MAIVQYKAVFSVEQLDPESYSYDLKFVVVYIVSWLALCVVLSCFKRIYLNRSLSVDFL